MSRILVLNMGMKSIRSIIFDTDGNKLATSSTPIVTALENEYVTQDPEEWWAKGAKVIRDTLENVDAESVDYITATTSSSCLLAIDHDFNAITHCMMVSDKRARKEAEYIRNLKEFKRVHADTNLNMDSYLMLPKALWIKNNELEIYDKTYKFLSPNDYLIAKLSGKEPVTDYLNAQKWHYDVDKNVYPTELLNEIGIDEDKLPKVVGLGECIGSVSEKTSQETGLSVKTKVIVSTYDAICSFIGSGVSKPGEACDISGTVTVFRTVAEKKIEQELRNIQQCPYKEAGIHIMGGSNNMGGGLIEWTKQCYYADDELPYELMEKDAMEAGVGAGGLIFLPYLLGERMPIWDDDARGVYFGLERTHTRKEMTRAVFESTGYIDLDMIKAIEDNGGTVNSIRVSGGLARVGLISQIKSDITGRDIEVLDEFETTASGAAMIALFGQNEFESIQDAAEVFARIRMIIKPNMKRHEKYQMLYSLYKETYNTLKPLFKKRSAIINGAIEEKKVKIENL